MTRQETIRLVLAQQTDALAALRQASDAFDQAVHHVQTLADAWQAMPALLQAIGAANQAQGRAIDAAIAANRTALTLFDGATQ